MPCRLNDTGSTDSAAVSLPKCAATPALSAVMPPTARTAYTASMITAVILITNCTRSVHSTAHMPGRDGVGHRDDEADADAITRPTRDRRSARAAERDREDLDHRPRHPAEDDQVDRDREVERAKAAQHRRRLAAVPHLGELDVGHHVRAPPEPREEEHREHAAHQHVPPQPVAGDAVRDDEPGDDERRVGGERRRDHRRAGEPPRHVAPRDEVLARGSRRPSS